MKTNYNNLNAFEISSIVVAAFGLVLIGVQMFLSLPMRTQNQISDALRMFDIRQSVSQTTSEFSLAYGSFKSFYDDFDLAFTQTFSYPDTVGLTTMKVADAIGNYADIVGTSYNHTNVAENSTNLGQVLGAFISAQETRPVVMPAQQDQTQAAKQYYPKKYYYNPPKILQNMQ